jgi:hypothetical protein
MFSFERTHKERDWVYYEVEREGTGFVGNIAVHKNGQVGVVPSDDDPGLDIDEREVDIVLFELEKRLGRPIHFKRKNEQGPRNERAKKLLRIIEEENKAALEKIQKEAEDSGEEEEIRKKFRKLVK